MQHARRFRARLGQPPPRRRKRTPGRASLALNSTHRPARPRTPRRTSAPSLKPPGMRRGGRRKAHHDSDRAALPAGARGRLGARAAADTPTGCRRRRSGGPGPRPGAAARRAYCGGPEMTATGTQPATQRSDVGRPRARDLCRRRCKAVRAAPPRPRTPRAASSPSPFRLRASPAFEASVAASSADAESTAAASAAAGGVGRRPAPLGRAGLA